MPSPPEEIEVSRPDKLLWPSRDITKRRYVDYLDAMSERMLPWLRERPVTLIRAPDGVGGKRYFQKAVSGYAPEWIRTVRIPAPSAGRDVDFVVCDDRATLLWLGNQATLEFHPAPVRADGSIGPICSSWTSTRRTGRSTQRRRSRCWCSTCWTT